MIRIRGLLFPYLTGKYANQRLLQLLLRRNNYRSLVTNKYLIISSIANQGCTRIASQNIVAMEQSFF
jgi:hypothetical protein